MKLTQVEIADFCRRLAMLLHAGIGIADGVFLLAEEETEPIRGLLQNLGSQMDEGKMLSEAMANSGAFPACVTGMVQMGERSGSMEAVLNALAQFYEQRSRSNRRIKHALAYPAILLALMLVVVGVLLTTVLPVFDDVYASLGSGLTGVAAALLHLGQLLAYFGKENAQVLDYWLDNSLFSGWQKPPKEFHLRKNVLRRDLRFYRDLGFRHIMTFACYLGQDYRQLHGDTPDILDYGKALEQP